MYWKLLGREELRPRIVHQPPALGNALAPHRAVK